MDGLHFAGVSASQEGALKRAYAAKIAAACNLPSNESVWDLQGENGTTTITDGLVEGFVAVPPGSYANVLARALYAPTFKTEMMQTTDDVPGVPPASAVGAIVLKLEQFQRQVPTTTVTTATTTVTTVTTTTTEAAAETTTRVHHDLRGSTTTGDWNTSGATRGFSLQWCELLLAGFLAANLVR